MTFRTTFTWITFTIWATYTFWAVTSWAAFARKTIASFATFTWN